MDVAFVLIQECRTGKSWSAWAILPSTVPALFARLLIFVNLPLAKSERLDLYQTYSKKLLDVRLPPLKSTLSANTRAVGPRIPMLLHPCGIRAETRVPGEEGIEPYIRQGVLASD